MDHVYVCREGLLDTGKKCHMWVWEHCRISPSCFLTKYCKRQLNQGALFCCILHCLLFCIAFSLCIFLYCFVCQYQSSDWLWRMPPKRPWIVSCKTLNSTLSYIDMLLTPCWCWFALDRGRSWSIKPTMTGMSPTSCGIWQIVVTVRETLRIVRAMIRHSSATRLWRSGSWMPRCIAVCRRCHRRQSSLTVALLYTRWSDSLHTPSVAKDISTLLVSQPFIHSWTYSAQDHSWCVKESWNKSWISQTSLHNEQEYSYVWGYGCNIWRKEWLDNVQKWCASGQIQRMRCRHMPFQRPK